MMETRTINLPLEIREIDQQRRIEGYALRFYNRDEPGTQFEYRPGVMERIVPGAVDLRQSVVALFNHDKNQLLGRTDSGTLSLSLDSKGLRYSILPSNTNLYRDLVEWIARGDVTGSSFSFTVNKDRFEKDGETMVRYIESINLFDVGPVTFPAYEASSTNLREKNVGQALDKINRRLRIITLEENGRD